MIPYGRHQVSEEDVAKVAEVLRGDWLTTGPMVDAFESSLQDWTGGVPVVAVSSGTAALHTAYAAAGLGRGDEVLTPPITFVATQAALVHLGATPVFVDVEPDTGNIDPRAVEAAIGPRTAAIVAVDYAGHPADMRSLRDIADRHGLLLIEDAAHSLGSKYGGTAVGALADVTTFSFFPTKNITTGEGGAVASPHPDLLERARRFSRQGLVRAPGEFRIRDEGPWHQEVHVLGLNYRMSDLHAALGASQLNRLSAFKRYRSLLKQSYDEALGDLPGTEVPVQRKEADPMWHLYPLRVPPTSRTHLYAQLRSAGIRAQVNYLPAYRHPALQAYRGDGDFPQSERFYAREISLPMHVALSHEDFNLVVDVTRATLSK